jgi:MarR family transcriptional regulator, lower aerobic nicotinate degradation pathway regulator
MKKSFEILSQLMPMIEDYEQGNLNMSVEGFLAHAYQKNEHKVKEKALGNEQMLRNQLGFYLNMLFRFMKIHTKSALKAHTVTTMDDFIFLATIHKEGSIRKTDLIKNNMVEIPSGIEIIKRLIKNDLVSEHADPDDKRAVRLIISEKGRTELFVMFGEMNQVGQVLAGDLTSNEVFELHHLLEKLAKYHQKLRETESK